MFFELPSLASEPLNNKSNETVSAGHTAISPHTLEKGREGGNIHSWVVKTQSVKFWQTFDFRGKGYSWAVKTQSAKF